MKYSIKKQFAYIFIGLMAGTILLCWFINNTFLERYYIQNKQKALLEAYYSINGEAQSGDITSDAFDIELQKISSKYNISYIVLDTNSKTVKASINDTKVLAKQLLDSILGRRKGINEKALMTIDGCEMHYATDSRTNTEFIEMWGVLDNGSMFLMRTPLEGIRDSVKIANRFLAYTGISALIFGSLIVWYVSRKITKPILKLADISERMTHLDFEARYKGNEKNEIALLGKHINQLSYALENTISELKTANNELQNDIEMKEKADNMRKEFLSNVSHELKTPIALIQGYAEGLKDGIHEDEESKDFYCDVIIDEASKMNTMVKKLLTLNQLEFGSDAVVMERFDIASLIRNYIHSAEILTKQNKIEVRFYETSPVYVWADEFKIEEVFNNYFSNALNHTADEKIIDVKITRHEDKVRISVFNTGNKIPEESIMHIWDKFYKVDKARTREYGGSGIGLSIVKAIMESLNEKFGAVNYDNGVEFWFELSIN